MEAVVATNDDFIISQTFHCSMCFYLGTLLETSNKMRERPDLDVAIQCKYLNIFLCRAWHEMEYKCIKVLDYKFIIYT